MDYCGWWTILHLVFCAGAPCEGDKIKYSCCVSVPSDGVSGNWRRSYSFAAQGPQCKFLFTHLAILLQFKPHRVTFNE
jgi:hypothetical protein